MRFTCYSRQGGVSLYRLYHAASNLIYKPDRLPLLPWVILSLLTHLSTLGLQHFRDLLTLVWGFMALSLHFGKSHFQYSAYFSFRSVSWMNFVYNYGITEMSNEKMYVLIKVLSA